jgi:hypothetical protein
MRIRIVVAVAAACAALVLVAGGLASGRARSHGHAQASVKTENRLLFAVLTGRKEVSPTGQRRAGDPDGRGSFTALVKGGQLCFGITVKNLDQPVAAHIHKGRRNQAGSIVVPLTQPATGDPGASSGCVPVNPALAHAILKNPHRYYANVHTMAFPGGAVRGQLFAKSN